MFNVHAALHGGGQIGVIMLDDPVHADRRDDQVESLRAVADRHRRRLVLNTTRPRWLRADAQGRG